MFNLIVLASLFSMSLLGMETEHDEHSHTSDISTVSTSSVVSSHEISHGIHRVFLDNGKEEFEVKSGATYVKILSTKNQPTAQDPITFYLQRTGVLQRMENDIEIQLFYKDVLKDTKSFTLGKKILIQKRHQLYSTITKIHFDVAYPIDKITIRNKNAFLRQAEMYKLTMTIRHQWNSCQSKIGEGICCGFTRKISPNGLIPTACIRALTDTTAKSYSPCESNSWPWNLKDFDPETNHVICNQFPNSAVIEHSKGISKKLSKSNSVIVDIGATIEGLKLYEDLDYTDDLYLPIECEVQTTDKENNFGVTITDVQSGKVLQEDCTLHRSIFRRLRSYVNAGRRKTRAPGSQYRKPCTFQVTQTGPTKPQVSITSTRWFENDKDEFQITNCKFVEDITTDGVYFEEKPGY